MTRLFDQLVFVFLYVGLAWPSWVKAGFNIAALFIVTDGLHRILTFFVGVGEVSSNFLWSGILFLLLVADRMRQEKKKRRHTRNRYYVNWILVWILLTGLVALGSFEYSVWQQFVFLGVFSFGEWLVLFVMTAFVYRYWLWDLVADARKFRQGNS